MEETKRRKRRIFAKEFKSEAVELIEKLGIPRAAEELDVDQATLRAWQKKAKNPESSTAEGKKSYAELERENRRLNRELGYIKEINKVLKKSTAIFSRDHMGGLK